MKPFHSIIAFLAVTALATTLFAVASPAEQQPNYKPAPFATADSMNGYSLKEYEDFWKNPAKWHFVTVRYRKDTGEMRLTYANDLAWKALLAGGKEYPEGAVFGKIGLMTHEDPAFTSSAVPAGARRYQLMIRDKVKGKETNGWVYALFDGKGKAVAEDQDIAAMACYACHALVPEKGDVFSEPFHLDVGATQAAPAAEAMPRIEFSTADVSALPEKIRSRLPKEAKQVRMVQGKLMLNLFRGTIDEIRPTLVKETLKSGLPAMLVSKDGTLFSVVYVGAKDNACTMAGGKAGLQVDGFYTTGVLPGKDSPISEHRHCEQK